MNVVFKNRTILINYLKILIDDYYKQLIDDNEFSKIISQIFIANMHLIKNYDGEYFFKFKQDLGIKRIRLIEYSLLGPDKYTKERS